MEQENKINSFEDEASSEYEQFSEVENDTSVTKCPACGANMIYLPGENCLYCEHCGTKQEIQSRNSEELAFERLLKENNTWADETHVFRCENCGAKEVLDKNEFAKSCSFCGTTNIVETDELSGIKPNAIVPFRLSKDDACGIVKKWARKKLFAPRKFKKSVNPEEVKGVYNPAFSFDTSTFSHYSGVLGKYYYRTKRVNGKTVQERYIRYFNVSGNYSMFFDDVLIQASTIINQKSLNKLQPFNTNDSNEYAQEFLSGFTANQYTKDGVACWEEAKTLIRQKLRAAILSQYTYDIVSSFNVSTECNNITYKYILLPVYVGHCNWRQKLYNFFVNGFNGKVTGKTPVSPLKIFITVVVGLAVVSAVGFLYSMFGG